MIGFLSPFENIAIHFTKVCTSTYLMKILHFDNFLTANKSVYEEVLFENIGGIWAVPTAIKMG